MTQIQSLIDTGSSDFAQNRNSMLAMIDSIRALERRAPEASARMKERFERRGQILPRERVARLIDPGSPYLELAQLVNYGVEVEDLEKSIPGGSVICGIGYVSGARCVIAATDSGINAGASQSLGREKLLRTQDVARENKMPFIHLVESAGANLRSYKVEGFVRGGALFYNFAKLSAAGIPVITVVHGSSTAGGAYMPGMSDYVVMVRGRAKAFLAGPPLLKAATGEIATDEELGGAEMHATVSGLAEYLAEDDTDALRYAREVVAKLHWNDRLAPTQAPSFREPRYDPDELAGVVPQDYRKPYDVHEVIARIVDDSDFLDFKPGFGADTVCGHGQIEGRAVGIIGNNGPISPGGAAKATQFIQICCQSGAPIVYLQNTTGFIVGREPETMGMIKHGAKMIQAVSNATVPQITLMIGASFGAGNYGMCGRAYNPRFIFSWPSMKMAVMGGEQAAQTMSIVTAAALKRKGQKVDKKALKRMEDEIIANFDSQSGAVHTSARLLDDGIIDPRDSRRVLAFALSICREAGARPLYPSSFGVARI